jgi:sporulation protein YlmC with PRC-barrel domain
MNVPTAVSPESLIDRKIVDSAGAKIGVVAQVYLDDQTGQPDWVTVNTGLFGMKENFVPLVRAKLVGKTLVLPFTKAVLKDSPAVDDPRHLDKDQEGLLYAYYAPHLVGGGTTNPNSGNQPS